jgi:hypothetical protein
MYGNPGWRIVFLACPLFLFFPRVETRTDRGPVRWSIKPHLLSLERNKKNPSLPPQFLLSHPVFCSLPQLDAKTARRKTKSVGGGK